MTITVNPTLSAAQDTAPFADALRRHAQEHPLVLMVPGHGASLTGPATELAEYFGQSVVEMDVPLLVNGLNSGINNPLEQAQALAAEAWGARKTWFVTNGSSQSNRAVMLALRGMGRDILIQRSMHSSAIDGMAIADLRPQFIEPTIDTDYGIVHGVTPEQIDRALTEQAAAGHTIHSVFIVSPSYFGSVADVAGIAKVVHAHGAILVVDAAWGAHFGFHPRLPESPIRLGADLVITSTHKLGGSFTQSAMLHLADAPAASTLEPLIERALNVTASTSENAHLFASLDIARHWLATHPEEISASIDAVDEAREAIRSLDGFDVLSDTFDKFPDVVANDPLHLVIDTSGLGISGQDAKAHLVADSNVHMEMATPRSLVGIIGAGATIDLARFVKALKRLPRTDRVFTANDFPPLPRPSSPLYSLHEAFFAETEVVRAEDAIGRASADALASYPPGIPNLLPGEAITAEAIAFLQAVARTEVGWVRGAIDPSLEFVRVVKHI